MAAADFVEKTDLAIANFFGSWNVWTLVLGALLVVVLVLPLFTGQDPDIHPFLLARQSQASPIRHPGESAVYRANEIPYGYPLRKGLGVKEPGAAKWSAGRDGDLRDVWRVASRGPINENGQPSGPRAKMYTILGRQKVIEQDLNEVSRMINAIGEYFQEHRTQAVAVSLSNSVELLAAVFAGAFYNFKPILMPYNLPQDKLSNLLSKTNATVLIAEAGTLDLESVLASAPSLKHILWVAKEGSKHIDWNEVPTSAEGKITVATWHELVEQRKAATSLPTATERDSPTLPVAMFFPNKTEGDYELIQYTPANLVAGTGGLIGLMTRTQKITYQDILLPVSSLSDSYTFCWTLAALFSNASIALNSVAGDSVDLTLAATGIAPTIIVASSTTIANHYEKLAAAGGGGLIGKFNAYFMKQTIASGNMPAKRPVSIEPHLAALRALFISQRDIDTRARVSSTILSALRLATGSRIGYALTTARVAGAVSQTNIFDYRNKGTSVNVGAPLTSIELYMTGDKDEDLDQATPKGKIIVKGPAVVGGKTTVDILAQIDKDNTINLL